MVSKPLPHSHRHAVILALLDDRSIPPSKQPCRYISNAGQLASRIVVPLNPPPPCQLLGTNVRPCIIISPILLIILSRLPPIIQDKKPRRCATIRQTRESCFDAFWINLAVKGIPRAPSKVVEALGNLLLASDTERTSAVRNSGKSSLQQEVGVFASRNEQRSADVRALEPRIPALNPHLQLPLTPCPPQSRAEKGSNQRQHQHIHAPPRICEEELGLGGDVVLVRPNIRRHPPQLLTRARQPPPRRLSHLT
mmetsp:Transcript_8438/g.16483  ORF Transcript_8438/g.16483 Transcript_8438/m.16483 type:complete len:252 (-) Transcript_8438:849-1604(-)